MTAMCHLSDKRRIRAAISRWAQNFEFITKAEMSEKCHYGMPLLL
jgi:hypothetical protein